MSANLEAKKLVVEEIVSKMKKAKTISFVNYSGLNVEQDTKMRKAFREAGAEYKVYKNRLVVKALNSLGLTGSDKLLEGSNAVAFSFKDEVSGPKILANTIKETNKMQFVFGIVDGKLVDASVMETLSKLPSKEILLSMLANVLSSPMQRLAIALDQVANSK